MINNKEKYIFLFILVLLMSYLSAERFLGIDRDYYDYLFFFEELDYGYSGRFERGFVLFSNIVKFLFDSFWILLFLVSFISLLIKIFLLSKLPFFLFWIGLYFLILFPVHEMTQLRVCISLAFAYLSLHQEFEHKKHTFSLFFFAIAVSFHWTVLIFSPFVLIWRYVSKHYVAYYITASAFSIIFIILFMNKFNIINPQVDDMIINAKYADINYFSARNVLFIFISLIGLFNAKKIPAERMFWFYISLFGIIVWYSLSSMPVFAHRLFELTFFSYFFWIPSLPKTSRLVAMTIFSILSLYLFFYGIYIDHLFQ